MTTLLLLFASVLCVFASTTAYMTTAEAADDAYCNGMPSTGDISDPTSAAAAAKRARLVPNRKAGANIDRVLRILPATLFQALFPSANLACGPTSAPYNHESFIRAVGSFPHFCDDVPTGSSLSKDDACKTELATLFAHISQETGRGCSSLNASTTALYHFEEMNCYSSGGCAYTQASGDFPPTPGQRYYGRGPFQLSYNYNYGPFSQVVYGDKKVLLDNPDLVVSSDPQYSWLAFSSALWFYMTAQPPKPSMHDVVVGHWTPSAKDTTRGMSRGFGATINIINGGLECNTGADKGLRIEAYDGYCKALGVTSACGYGPKDCRRMPLFEEADVLGYFGASQGCGCKLVKWQTPFALSYYPDDVSAYKACVSNQADCHCDIPPFAYEPQPTPASDWIPKRTGCKCPDGSGTSSGSSTSPTGVFATCTKVVVAPNPHQIVTEEHCAACALGAQSWWPCNKPGLCHCAESTNADKPISDDGKTTEKAKSATTISSTIPAVLISSVVFLYLSRLGY